MLDFLSTANQIINKLAKLWSIKLLRYCLITVIVGYCSYSFTTSVVSRLGYSDIPSAIISIFQTEEVEEEPTQQQSTETQSKDQTSEQSQSTDEQSKDQTSTQQQVTTAPVVEETPELSLWERLTSWFSSSRVKGGNKSTFGVWEGILMFWSILKYALPLMAGIFGLNYFFNRKKAAPLPILDNQNQQNDHLPELYTKGDTHEDETL